MTLIVRPIFRRRRGGNWWAWSQVKPNHCYSLHTKNQQRAQADYDRQVRELTSYIEQEERRSTVNVQLWQPGDNREGD